jgi:outer membrane protein OmpA-like peptidoglycan-associated protein
VGPGIAAQSDVVRVDIEKARKSGAYRCAPRELAMAETEVDFAETELAQGNFIRAQAHIDVAVENVNAALANSKGCGPKRVLIKQNLDRDGDGILDDADACPDKPEDKDLFEDEDGCPDPDNDQDTVLDPLDKCPNTAGPPENEGCPYGDRDGDGIADNSDKCPDDPEDMDGDRDEDGCPDIDTDGDGLDDDVDKCPQQPEDKDQFEDEDGCPDPDNDKDGILDTADECPNEAGPLEAKGCPDQDGDNIADKDDKCPTEPGVPQPNNPERHGCPILDTDGDGIPDPEDKCPTEFGIPQPDNPDQHGCPKKYKLVVIKKDRIEIKQQVNFATGKAIIKRDSYYLLEEVADAIKSAGVTKLRIEGHTDSVGSDSMNMRLSDRRANSVMRHLIEKNGIDPAIMTAVGYGETKPIASNRTRSGRAKNRRVEFHIVER